MHDQDSCVLLGRDARRRLDEIVEDLMRRQREQVPELWVTDAPALDDAVRRSTHDNSDLMLAVVQRATPVPRWLPPGARLEAELAAQYGARLDALLRSYSVGQQGLVEHFLAAVEERAIADPARGLAELRVATQRLHAYISAVLPLVAGEYDAERRRMQTDPDLRRLRMVQAALAGDSSVALDYDVQGTHVALVAADAHAEQAVAATAAELGSPSLAVRATGGSCWAWLATADTAEAAERLRRRGLDGPGGLGGPGTFADAHRQAVLAERVARSRGDGLVDVRSAALEALALGDQRTAWELARSELGQLGEQDRHGPLLGTLEAWFATSESLTATARTLRVAPRTVSYRLRRAEDLLGHPIASRRAELEAALRLRRLFGDGPPV
jgi:hypothetical protein